MEDLESGDVDDLESGGDLESRDVEILESWDPKHLESGRDVQDLESGDLKHSESGRDVEDLESGEVYEVTDSVAERGYLRHYRQAS